MTQPRKPARGAEAVASVVDAVRVDSADTGAAGFTYTVLIDPEPTLSRPRAAGDRRIAPRRRTRLRSGKIVNAHGNFVTECLVHDLSTTGVRLRLPAGVVLPPLFRVYDDQSGDLKEAVVSWQRDGEAGVRFLSLADSARDRIIAADMRRKYYKLPR